MTTSLWLQVLCSFIAGGAVITLLSLLAEKANERISGIIMMFPSTIVLGFFFLGITTSAEKVAAVIPTTLVPIGLVAFSSVIYIFFSELYSTRITKKPLQIAATYGSSSLVWFIMAAPFATWRLEQVAAGIAGYIMLMTLAHYLLNKKSSGEKLPRLVYSKVQIVLRAVFTGTIIAIVVLLGKTLDPFWAGIFTMYPAATFASLMIFHYYYQPSQLSYFMKKAPVGTCLVCIYALAAMHFFPEYGVIGGTVLSYSLCLVCSLLLIKYQHYQQQKQLQRLD